MELGIERRGIIRRPVFRAEFEGEELNFFNGAKSPEETGGDHTEEQ